MFLQNSKVYLEVAGAVAPGVALGPALVKSPQTSCCGAALESSKILS